MAQRDLWGGGYICGISEGGGKKNKEAYKGHPKPKEEIDDCKGGNMEVDKMFEKQGLDQNHVFTLLMTETEQIQDNNSR